MEYRPLEPEEYGRLQFIFGPRGLPLPDPIVERVCVVEDEGQIVAMAIRRLLPMLDGLWVEKRHRGGKINYEKLARITEGELNSPGSRCYALAVRSFTGRILAQAGYEEVGKILEKRF